MKKKLPGITPKGIDSGYLMPQSGHMTFNAAPDDDQCTHPGTYWINDYTPFRESTSAYCGDCDARLPDRDDDYDPSPYCPDPGCPGQYGGGCTFPGYADNH